MKILDVSDINQELYKIGFDVSYLNSGALKHSFLNIKIQNLLPHTATIIKQTALSKGADAAVHRDVLMNKIEHSDLILSGSIKQLYSIFESLKSQPFGLKSVAESGLEILGNLSFKSKLPQIMGILNLTTDSFSDGGLYLDTQKAINRALEMIEEGASIIDVGAESTRPNALPVNPDIETERLVPVISFLKEKGIRVSVDTRNSKTALEAVKLGADIINDVSFLEYDKNTLDVIKTHDVDYVLTHSRGIPSNMDSFQQYLDVNDDIFNEISSKLNFLIQNGIKKERVILDVGFGFAKDVEQNFSLMKKISEFNSFGVKTLVGASRKRFLKSIIEGDNNSFELLDELTMLSSFYFAQKNVDYIRVHNVKKSALALKLYSKIIS